MKKLGILVDSFSGLTQKEIEDLGFEFVPLTIIVDGQSFADGSEFILERDAAKIWAAENVKTSMPAIGTIIQKFDEMQNQYDHVIYLPTPKAVSSTMEAAQAVSKDYPKVRVLSTILTGYAIISSLLKAREIYEQSGDIDQTVNFINNISENSITYILPKNSDQIIKGGRLKGAKKLLFEKAKLIPKLQLEIDQLKVVALKRNFTKMVRSTVEKIVETISNYKNYNWEINHTGDLKSVETALQIIKEYGVDKIRVMYTSGIVAIHTGLGAISINVYPKI